MFILENERLACAQCIRGHRAADCFHRHKPLISIRPRGRPSTQEKNVRVRYESVVVTHEGMEPVETKNGRAKPGQMKRALYVAKNSLFTLIRTSTKKGFCITGELSLLEAYCYLEGNPQFDPNCLDEARQGLSVSVLDVNLDGMKDIFIASRFIHLKDALPMQDFQMHNEKNSKDYCKDEYPLIDNSIASAYTMSQIHAAQRVFTLIHKNKSAYNEDDFVAQLYNTAIDPCNLYLQLTGKTAPEYKVQEHMAAAMAELRAAEQRGGEIAVIPTIVELQRQFGITTLQDHTRVCLSSCPVYFAKNKVRFGLLSSIHYPPYDLDSDSESATSSESSTPSKPGRARKLKNYKLISKARINGKQYSQLIATSTKLTSQAHLLHRIQNHGYNAPNYTSNFNLPTIPTEAVEAPAPVVDESTAYEVLDNEYNAVKAQYELPSFQVNGNFEQFGISDIRTTQPKMKYRNGPLPEENFDFELQFMLPSKEHAKIERCSTGGVFVEGLLYNFITPVPSDLRVGDVYEGERVWGLRDSEHKFKIPEEGLENYDEINAGFFNNGTVEAPPAVKTEFNLSDEDFVAVLQNLDLPELVADVSSEEELSPEAAASLASFHDTHFDKFVQRVKEQKQMQEDQEQQLQEPVTPDQLQQPFVFHPQQPVHPYFGTPVMQLPTKAHESSISETYIRGFLNGDAKINKDVASSADARAMFENEDFKEFLRVRLGDSLGF
ncbi:hypothetical protein WICPIJ_005475 [Wickerhamomyces pijperi]|uniref:Copper-fist domain-containing protein n=1 Tax=Wickerhamomyces pijperi TaxID=599730 RepID=A0A9P8Q3F7_WICPI|nr:hypothetical protein WICPIJ_005475 [Wickerhamomyces pijperi]